MLEHKVRLFTPVDGEAARIREMAGERLPARSWLERFRPISYLHPDDPYHGLLHTGEVVVFSVLDAAMGGKANLDVVGIAAGYHDFRHSGAKQDFDHGDKGAEWLIENAHLLTGEFSYGAVIKAAEVVRLHVPSDDLIMSPELIAVKNGDSVGRVRFEDNLAWSFDPAYLRSQHSQPQLLVGPARIIHAIGIELMARDFGDGFTCALEASVRAGYVPNV